MIASFAQADFISCHKETGDSCAVYCLCADQFADLLFDLVHLGEAVQSVLGENLLPVEEDFERSGVTGGHRHRPKLLVIIVQQVLRQTGGSREIPSGGAVLDPHHRLLSRWLLAGRVISVGHVLSSVRLRPSREAGTGSAGNASVTSVARTNLQCDRISSNLSHAACPRQR